MPVVTITRTADHDMRLRIAGLKDEDGKVREPQILEPSVSEDAAQITQILATPGAAGDLIEHGRFHYDVDYYAVDFWDFWRHAELKQFFRALPPQDQAAQAWAVFEIATHEDMSSEQQQSIFFTPEVIRILTGACSGIKDQLIKKFAPTVMPQDPIVVPFGAEKEVIFLHTGTGPDVPSFGAVPKDPREGGELRVVSPPPRSP